MDTKLYINKNKIEKYANWLSRNGKRKNTIYTWCKRLEKMYEVDFSDEKSINMWLDNKFGISKDKNEIKTQTSFGSTYQTVAAIRSYLEFIDKEEIIEKIKYPKGKMPRRIKTLNDKQITTLLNECDKIQKEKTRRYSTIIIRLLLETGMRRSEVYHLRKKWLELEENKITIPKEMAKGKQDRYVFISDTTKEMLKKYINEYNKTKEGNLWKWKCGAQMIRLIVREVANNAGLPAWVNPHVLRHTFATRLIKKDVNLRIIQTLLGHASISSTEIYTHLAEEDIKNGAEKGFI